MKREEILNMLKEGTITTEECMKLLEAMEESSVSQGYAVATSNSGKPKMMRIIVEAVDNGKPVNVRVNLPVTLIKAMLSVGQKLEIDGKDISNLVDVDMILQAIDSEAMGEIVTVDSEEAQVHIFIE